MFCTSAVCCHVASCLWHLSQCHAMPRELKTAPSGRRRVADSHDAAPRLRHGRCHLCTSKNVERTEEFSADSAVSRNVWKNISSTLKVFLFKSCAKVQLRPARHLCWKKRKYLVVSRNTSKAMAMKKSQKLANVK